MDIYLVGHGAWNTQEGWFTVPDGVTIHFYCKHQKKFDSSWEWPLKEGQEVQHRDYVHQVYGPGERCIDYWLTYPGGISSTVNFKDMYPIKAPAYIGANMRDGGFYAVKERTEDGWYALLSRIAATMAHPCDLHWFACRDEMSPASIGPEDLYREANSYPGKQLQRKV
jgi:hypothetical protein